MHNVQCAVTREQWHCSVCRLVGVHSAQCTVHSAQCTVYSVQCTVYSAQCTVHSVQCTVHRAQMAEDSELNRLLKRGSLRH